MTDVTTEFIQLCSYANASYSSIFTKVFSKCYKIDDNEGSILFNVELNTIANALAHRIRRNILKTEC